MPGCDRANVRRCRALKPPMQKIRPVLPIDLQVPTLIASVQVATRCARGLRVLRPALRGGKQAAGVAVAVHAAPVSSR